MGDDHDEGMRRQLVITSSLLMLHFLFYSFPYESHSALTTGRCYNMFFKPGSNTRKMLVVFSSECSNLIWGEDRWKEGRWGDHHHWHLTFRAAWGDHPSPLASIRVFFSQ